MVLKFRSGTHGLFEELGRHSNGGGSQVYLNCGTCKQLIKYVLFKGASYDSQMLSFGLFEKVLFPDTFEVFLSGSIYF